MTIERAWHAVQRAAERAHPELSLLRQVPLLVDPAAYREPRNYAFCTLPRTSVPEIHIAPEAERLAGDVVRGILWHELGHAVDHLYEFEDEALSRRVGESPERRADRLVRELFGVRIKYQPDTLLQCLDCRGLWPRPRGLG